MAYVMVAVPAELLPKIAELVAEYTGESVLSDDAERSTGQVQVVGEPAKSSVNGSDELINRLDGGAAPPCIQRERRHDARDPRVPHGQGRERGDVVGHRR